MTSCMRVRGGLVAKFRVSQVGSLPSWMCVRGGLVANLRVSQGLVRCQLADWLVSKLHACTNSQMLDGRAHVDVTSPSASRRRWKPARDANAVTRGVQAKVKAARQVDGPRGTALTLIHLVVTIWVEECISSSFDAISLHHAACVLKGGTGQDKNLLRVSARRRRCPGADEQRSGPKESGKACRCGGKTAVTQSRMYKHPKSENTPHFGAGAPPPPCLSAHGHSPRGQRTSALIQ